MKYKDQLNSDFWYQKRKEILQRDKFTCKNCLNKNLIHSCREGLILKIEDKTNNLLNIAQGWNDSKTLLLVISEIDEKKISPMFIQENRFNNLSCEEIMINDSVYYEAIQEEDNSEEEVIAEFNNVKGVVNQNKINIHCIKGNIGYKFAKNLHIHHKYYQLEKLAWEYPDDALDTLCWFCHEMLHSKSEIDILDKKGIKIGTKKLCNRCHGAGKFPEFNHVQNGICFKCKGNKFESENQL